MAEEKKILVIDDHYEMLEFLRSMLELANQDYEVLAVPSAEEGLLELRRTPFDLVITDVRLPGMSGFDLVRQVKTIRSNTPIIMITAYSTTQGQHEAEESGVFRYFPKPLDVDEMMSAVHKALYGDSVDLPKVTAVSSTPAASANVTNPVRKRLDLLRTDTGAAKLVLATISGQVISQVGDGRIRNTEKLVSLVGKNLEDSFLLAQELDSREPFTLQYHAGDAIELYVATVGVDHFLAMFFDVKARRGRIGTVWVFAQRAIKELLVLLPASDQPILTESATKPVTDQLNEQEETVVKMETAVSDPAPPLSSHIEAPPVELAPESEKEDNAWLDIKPEQLADLLDNKVDLLEDSGEINAFWDEALAEAGSASGSSGFSLEEAKRQGLIPTDLDLENSTE